MTPDIFFIMKAELSLVIIILGLLIIKVWDGIKANTTLLYLANVLLGANFIFGFFFNQSGELFSGMYYTNDAHVLEKNILNFTLLIVSLLSYDWLKTHRHLLEFYILLLCATLGLFYMISSGNFLMFYVGLELASLPLAALANFDLEKRKSSEAAVKLILLSAFSSAVLLFGISLLYGSTGTINFFELTQLITGDLFQVVALLIIFSGFAFKLSAVPFHFWTADVYEGAPVAIASYLSVASKAATVFVFISVLTPLFSHSKNIWFPLLTLIIVLTITIGNLFAIRQTNLKRFLAFSSIAQVGYILFGLLADDNDGITASVYFLVVYALSNLGVFGVISLVSVNTGKENIDDYKGFYRTNPALSWMIGIALFSLAGIPPTAGFFGKMFLMTAGASTASLLLVGFVTLNMVISLYYYLRVIKSIFIDHNDHPIPKQQGSASLKLALLLCFIGIVVTGFTGALFEYIRDALIL